ncbi:MAG: hypothetical protein KW802_03535 [Candidatus Doudnabacteria bacterium]|nr:hypothetical protein [Candidatus Doudnabacteria bacterium]
MPETEFQQRLANVIGDEGTIKKFIADYLRQNYQQKPPQALWTIAAELLPVVIQNRPRFHACGRNGIASIYCQLQNIYAEAGIEIPVRQKTRKPGAVRLEDFFGPDYGKTSFEKSEA